MHHASGHLVVLHQAAIGDFVLAMSVVQPLRAVMRSQHVVAIASAASARLAGGRSVIDVYRSPEDVGLHTLFATGDVDARLLDELRDADCVLSFLSDAVHPIHGRLVHATRGRVVSVDPRPVPETLSARRHITSQWADAVRGQGLQISEPLPPRIRMEIERPSFGASEGRDVIIHPGSGGAAKCWAVESFMQLADALTPAGITWMLGPVECEAQPQRFEPLMRRLASTRDRPFIEADLVKAAARLSVADLYIGNDAGMTHVAAALGVPTVVIFGTTDPNVWRPLGDHVTVVAPDEPATSGHVPVEKVIARARSLVSPR